ncbi:PAS domain S-box protein [Pedobacter terrae]|uniref:PAS domain S-box protein n=1 Tax=Pedobacter terrae TaxID=405671 RepID=UPI002FFA1C10
MDLTFDEDLFRNTIDSSIDMIQVFKAVRNEHGDIVDFVWILNNKASENIYGDVIGKSLLTLNPGVVREGIFDTFKAVVETGISDQSIRHYLHEQFDGWYLQSAVKQGDGVATTTKDITDIKKAEEIERQNRNLLQDVIDAPNIGIAVYKAVRNNEGEIIDFIHEYINQASKGMLGEDWTGRLFTAHGENALLQMPQFLKVMATGQSSKYIRQADFRGNKVWFSITNTFLDGDRLVHTWEDITERKNAELDLKESKELVQTVFDITINPIAYHKAIRDDYGKIIDFEFQLENLSARKYSVNDRKGQRYSEAYPGIKDTVIFEKYCDVVESGNALDGEVEISLKGNNHWFQVMAAKLGDGLVASAIDITGRKKAEVEILRLKDEIAQRAEQKYRSIFDSIDEGLCIYEVIYDEEQRPIDLKWIEVNPNFEKQTGLRDVIGKRHSELLLYTESYWLETYDKVVKTGEPLHFEEWHGPTQRWYDTYSSRDGGPESKRVTVLFTDITEQKHLEQRQRFLLKFSDALRMEQTEEDIASRSLHLLADFLQLDRCYVALCSLDDDKADIFHQVGNETVPPMPDQIRLSDFPDAFKITFDATLVIEDFSKTEGLSDIDRQNIGALGLCALVAATLRKNEHEPLWCIVAVSSVPRAWTKSDISLIEEVTERTWTSMEKARAETNLRTSEEKYRSLFDNIDEGFALMELHRDANGAVVDLTYREVNGAFIRFTGWNNAIGKRGTELMPNLEPELLELMRSVADNGVTYRKEDYVADLDKWYDVHYSCVYEPGNNFILAVFKDTTERKRNEAQQRLLLHISDKLGRADSLKDVQTIVTNSLRDHYDAGWCYYVEWDEDKNSSVVLYDSRRDGLLSLAGTHDVSGIPEFIHILKSGQILNVKDYEDYDLLSQGIRERYTAVGFRSMLVASLKRHDRLISSLIIGDTKIRNWSHHDETLLADIAERTWAAMERAKAEEALRESRKRFKSIANLVPDLLWDSEPDGSTNWYNQRWLEYTGQSLEEAVGWGWIDAIHPDDRAGSSKRYAEAVEAGVSLRQEHRIRNYEGQYRWFVVDALPLKDEQGRVVKMYGAATDIHDRKQAEEALKKSEEQFRKAIEDAPVPVIMHAEDGEVLQISRSWSELTGFNLEKVSNMDSWFTKAYGEGADAVRNHMHQLFNGKKRTINIEFAVATPNGELRHWSFSASSPGKLKDDRRYIVGMAIDITDRKLHEEYLKNFSNLLEKQIQVRTTELQESRDQLRSLLDTTLVQMSILKAVRNEQGEVADLEIIAVNHELEKETGRSDLIGKLYAAEYPGIRETGIFDLIIKAINTGEPQGTEYFYTYEGFEKWFSCMFVKFADGVVATNMDISAHKRAEEERFKNYVLLQQSEEIASIGTWDFNLTTNHFTWSAGMYRLFDLKKGTKVMPEVYLDYTTKRGRAAAERTVAHIRQSDTDFEETLELNIAGNVKILHVKAAIVQNDSGRVERVLGVNLDISAMRQAEEKIKRMEKEQQLEIFRTSLSTLEEERHRISESLHNGIGQILYGIKINMSGLRHGASSLEFEKNKAYVSNLLTDAIVETRRISHELMPTTLEQFGLKSALNDICRQLSGEVNFNCQTTGLRMRMEKYLELAVYRTVQELMSNVVKHAKATKCEVNVGVVRREIQIRVADNGQGIAAGTKRKPGIGMASIRSKIKLLNGDIQITTAPGRGTIIDITIPKPK